MSEGSADNPSVVFDDPEAKDINVARNSSPVGNVIVGLSTYSQMVSGTMIQLLVTKHPNHGNLSYGGRGDAAIHIQLFGYA